MRSLVALALLLAPSGALADPSAREILDKVLESDSFGLSSADVRARAVVKDDLGSKRELSFSGRSRKYAPRLSRSILRFSAPADINGVGFLQLQKKDGDDDRHLFLPELKKSRRISGKMRGNAFMGTDFNYADLDRRDMRDASATSKPDENLGKFACHHLDVQPTGADAVYARLEVWVRKDNMVPLKTLMFNKAGVLLKTLQTQELKRIKGRWFITKSLMTNHAERRTSELSLEEITPREDAIDEEFTVRNLEKI